MFELNYFSFRKLVSKTVSRREQTDPAGYGIWIGDNKDDFAQNAALSYESR